MNSILPSFVDGTKNPHFLDPKLAGRTRWLPAAATIFLFTVGSSINLIVSEKHPVELIIIFPLT